MKALKKGLLKKAVLALLIPALLLSHPHAAYAATSTPDLYLFDMVLRSLGVVARSEVGQWKAAYEGYLKSTGSQDLLNQLKGYEKAAWGSTVSGVDTLYWGVREWLSHAVISAPDGNGNYSYSLPSGPAPLPSLAFGITGFQGTRFADVNVPSDGSGYVYLFSQAYDTSSDGRPIYWRRDVYVPSGKDVFGIITGYDPYASRVTMKLFTPDRSSGTGYNSFSVKSLSTAYYKDDQSLYVKRTAFNSSWDWTTGDILTVMNLPIKVFVGASQAEKYCKTGEVEGVFNQNRAALWARGESAGANHGLMDWETPSVGSTFTLPADASRADSLIRSHWGDTPEKLSGYMQSINHFTIEYAAAYTVEHYKQDVADRDGNQGYTKAGTESLSGIAGKTALLSPREYAGFTYSPDLTTPQDFTITGDGKLVIRLYYTRDPVFYRVEHYKQDMADENGDREFMRDAADVLSGTAGASAAYTPREYEGFTYDPGSTAPAGPIIPEKEGLVVRLYYTRNQYPYLVEHYKAAVPGDGGGSWNLEDTAECKGYFGEPALYEKKSYPGYVFNSGLTENGGETVPSGSGLVVRLYYARGVYPYKVEHYVQSGYNAQGKKKWELKESEELSGYFGDPVAYTPKTYGGYRYTPGLTDAGAATIPAGGGLLVKLFYSQVTAVDVAIDTAADTVKKSASAIKKGTSASFFGLIPLVIFVILAVAAVSIYKNVFRSASSTQKKSGDRPGSAPGREKAGQKKAEKEHGNGWVQAPGDKKADFMEHYRKSRQNPGEWQAAPERSFSSVPLNAKVAQAGEWVPMQASAQAENNTGPSSQPEREGSQAPAQPPSDLEYAAYLESSYFDGSQDDFIPSPFEGVSYEEYQEYLEFDHSHSDGNPDNLKA